MSSRTALATQFDDPDFASKFTKQLVQFLPTQRWFTAKGKQIESCELAHCLPIHRDAVILVAEVNFADASQEIFQLPLAQLTEQKEQRKYAEQHASLVVMTSPGGSQLVDAVPLPAFRSALYELIHSEATTDAGLRCDAGTILHNAPASAHSIVPAIDTSNTAIIYADRFFFKLFRKLDQGLNPDLELVRYLSEHAKFEHCPPYAGSIGVGSMDADDYLNLGMMSGKVDNRGDAWEYFQSLTARYYSSVDGVDQETLDRAALLGKRTAEMHKGLARGADAGAMLAAEAMSPEYRTEITDAAQKLLARQMGELAAKIETLTPVQADLAKRVLDLKEDLNQQLKRLADRPMDLDLIRIHGDYHLGQVLVTDDDFYIIDFEGEPLLSIPERRRKRPALKDVAGMVRSFHYAARGQLLLNDKYDESARRELAPRGEAWFERVSETYLEAYYKACGEAKFLPKSADDRRLLLNLFILEKAIYEVAYELNSRPAWLAVPLNGVLRVQG